jgi:hypothetical protein
MRGDKKYCRRPKQVAASARLKFSSVMWAGCTNGFVAAI